MKMVLGATAVALVMFGAAPAFAQAAACPAPPPAPTLPDGATAKPAEMQEKMIAGKINKILSEMCLTGQAYVLDTNLTVEAAAKKEGAEILSYTRIAVGEGIEKVKEDYAAEVAKAMQV